MEILSEYNPERAYCSQYTGSSKIWKENSYMSQEQHLVNLHTTETIECPCLLLAYSQQPRNETSQEICQWTNE